MGAMPGGMMDMMNRQQMMMGQMIQNQAAMEETRYARVTITARRSNA